eukprot:TRINITY_DN18322_c0_g1_i1.p1 TRINITY_DN18322_c0_g1~~TRINITY_DN18322_c0_g1_i1.p1  ORF type:complete len:501 (+),score=146.60 TRINITY_DN18322_c0_g1_i1:46-1503(+)
MAAAGDGDGFIAVCDQTAISAHRTLLRVPPGPEGRYVALVHHAGKFHCIDATCYHMGGPLLTSEIEDIPGHGPCIVCPWHHYQISLEKGNKLYLGIDHQYKTTGKTQQRVHEVKLEGGKVWIRLSTEGTVASDEYAYKKPAPAQNASVRKLPRSGAIHGGGAPAPLPPAFGACPSGSTAPPPDSMTVGRMVSNSMRGGDGVAPWAMGTGSSAPPPSLLRGPAPPPPRRTPASLASVVKKTVLSHAHFTLTVALPSLAPLLGGRGQHVNVIAPGAPVLRPYTPYVTPESSPTEVVFYVKVYEGGKASTALAALKPGDAFPLEFPSLHGGFGKGFMRPETEAIAMVAGGTGIAPMLQVLLYLRRCREGKATDALGMENVKDVHLVLANHTVGDVPLLPLLAAVARAGAPSVHITHAITTPSSGAALPEGQALSCGRVDEALLLKAARAGAAPHATKLLICGPQAFNDAMRDLAAGIGHRPEDIHVYE